MSFTIGRLALRAPGSAAEDGRRLGELVADRLAAALAPRGADGEVDTVRVELQAAPGESAEALAGRIAIEVGRALEAGR